MKFQSIAKVLTAGVLSLGVFTNASHTDDASAKEKIRTAPIYYEMNDKKGLYFEDYTCEDFEQRFLVTKKEAKKLHLKKDYKFRKFFVAYFTHEIDTKKIHEANVKKITRKSTNKFVFKGTNKKVHLSQKQYLDLEGIKKATVLIDKVNGKIVLKHDYSKIK